MSQENDNTMKRIYIVNLVFVLEQSNLDGPSLMTKKIHKILFILTLLWSCPPFLKFKLFITYRKENKVYQVEWKISKDLFFLGHANLKVNILYTFFYGCQPLLPFLPYPLGTFFFSSLFYFIIFFFFFFPPLLCLYILLGQVL